MKPSIFRARRIPARPENKRFWTLQNWFLPMRGRMRVHVVPFTEIQMDIYKSCPHEELVIIMRRFMMRIAEKIARNIGAVALVTGESIGQVASQTLESMTATGSVVNMPILRPLVGMDKQEIMDRAASIDTYDTSILPYEDCWYGFLCPSIR